MKNTNNNERVVLGTDIQMTLPTKRNTWAIIKPYAEGVFYAVIGGFIVIGFTLLFVISAANGRCDNLGDKIGLASSVIKGECNLKINGEWKPLDTLNLKVEVK
jgi:hypothetical protein